MTPAIMPAISLASQPAQFDGAVGFTVAEGKDWSGALSALDAACGGAIKRTAQAASFDGAVAAATTLCFCRHCASISLSGRLRRTL